MDTHAKYATAAVTTVAASGLCAWALHERLLRWVGRKIEPYVPMRHSVLINGNTLTATTEHPAVSVEKDATRVSIIGCRLLGADVPHGSAPSGTGLRMS